MEIVLLFLQLYKNTTYVYKKPLDIWNSSSNVFLPWWSVSPCSSTSRSPWGFTEISQGCFHTSVFPSVFHSSFVMSKSANHWDIKVVVTWKLFYQTDAAFAVSVNMCCVPVYVWRAGVSKGVVNAMGPYISPSCCGSSRCQWLPCLGKLLQSTANKAICF